jgi:hypothetical protein
MGSCCCNPCMVEVRSALVSSLLLPSSLPSFLSVSLSFSFFFHTGVWTQGLTFARQPTQPPSFLMRALSSLWGPHPHDCLLLGFGCTTQNCYVGKLISTSSLGSRVFGLDGVKKVMPSWLQEEEERPEQASFLCLAVWCCGLPQDSSESPYQQEGLTRCSHPDLGFQPSEPWVE